MIDETALYERTELPKPYCLLSCQAVSRMIRRGDLPRPIKIGQRNFWRGKDILDHVENLQPKRAPKALAA